MTCITEIEQTDAEYAANSIIDHFSRFSNIEDYIRAKKIERIRNLAPTLPGLDFENEFFSDFTMHPSDMEFSIEEMQFSKYMRCMQLVSSHTHEGSIPGRQLVWGVRETNTNKLVGMIRFGSPTINNRPRNEFLGEPLKTTGSMMARFNNSAIMGFTIVPTQPFGFNYLGGKLLAAICCSHHARRTLNKKYAANICLFETTSLYGTSKEASQYDGMRPFLRYIGLTDSKFIPIMDDKTYHTLNNHFVSLNGGEQLVPDRATSKKMKRQSKIISLVRKELKQSNPDLLDKFNATMTHAHNLTEQKRTYISTYGFSNVAEYLTMKTDTLEKKENFDRFEIENVIKWWQNKASKRYNKLVAENRLRTKQEFWTEDNTELEIIR